MAGVVLFAYIGGTLWRNSRGRPLNAPATFIHPCQPIAAEQPPSGPGWAHELKHDGATVACASLHDVHLSADGVSDFDALHSRTADEKAVALAFDLLLSNEYIRRRPLIERKRALQWVLRKAREGIQYVEHAEGHGDKLFAAVCHLGRGHRLEAAHVSL